jgi:hypothetical protein
MADRLNRFVALDSLEIRGRLAPDRWTVFGWGDRCDDCGWALVQSLNRTTIKFSRCLTERVYHFTR